MDQVETANKVFDFKNAVNEGPTHVVDIVHEVIMRQVRAAMVVDAIYAIVTSLARHSPGENVYLVAFSCKTPLPIRSHGQQPLQRRPNEVTPKIVSRFA